MVISLRHRNILQMYHIIQYMPTMCSTLLCLTVYDIFFSASVYTPSCTRYALVAMTTVSVLCRV